MAKKPESKPVSTEDLVRNDYMLGVNHEQLAGKYNLSVAEVTSIIGA